VAAAEAAARALRIAHCLLACLLAYLWTGCVVVCPTNHDPGAAVAVAGVATQACVSTHDSQMQDAVPCAALADLGDTWREYDVVGIDEGQFFPDLVEFCEAAANAGKHVIVSALDSTFERKVCACVRANVCMCVAGAVTPGAVLCLRALVRAAVSQRV
jgi:thymidine kinase